MRQQHFKNVPEISLPPCKLLENLRRQQIRLFVGIPAFWYSWCIPCPCYMSRFMLRDQVPALCQSLRCKSCPCRRPCCMSTSMLHVHVNVYSASMSVSMLYVHFHAAYPGPCLCCISCQSRLPVANLYAHSHGTVSAQKIAPATKFLSFFDRTARENQVRY
jgi:hypothetical protein